MLVEITGGKLQSFIFALYIYIRQAPSLKVGLKAGQRVVEILDTQSGVDIFAYESYIGVCVGQEIAVMFLVIHVLVGLSGEKVVALYATVHRNTVLGGCVKCHRSDCEQCEWSGQLHYGRK